MGERGASSSSGVYRPSLPRSQTRIGIWTRALTFRYVVGHRSSTAHSYYGPTSDNSEPSPFYLTAGSTGITPQKSLSPSLSHPIGSPSFEDTFKQQSHSSLNLWTLSAILSHWQMQPSWKLGNSRAHLTKKMTCGLAFSNRFSNTALRVSNQLARSFFFYVECIIPL